MKVLSSDTTAPMLQRVRIGRANGYARLDQGGVHCGDEANVDSGASQETNTQEDCG